MARKNCRRCRRRRGRANDHRQRVNPVPPGLEGGRYRPLARADVRRIRDAALTVLERTGVELVESEWRRIFEQAGVMGFRISESR